MVIVVGNGHGDTSLNPEFRGSILEVIWMKIIGQPLLIWTILFEQSEME